jgi:hypothetical protein
MISESFSIAVVSAMTNSSDVGGLVGLNSGDIADSFVVPPAASANITGTNITNIGGLVGRLAGAGSIETSYAVAYGLCGATGMTAQGGLVGFVDGGSTAVSDSYWDKEVAAQSAMDPLCDNTAPYGISRSTAEMQDPMSYPPTWLATIWRLQANYYPDLLWFPLF